MSKSRGNIVRTETILDVLGADALRYFLLREVVFGQDGSFSFDALVQRYNSDLANGLGNLASRTLTMINRYFKGEVPYPSHTASRTPADDAIAETRARRFANSGRCSINFNFPARLKRPGPWWPRSINTSSKTSLGRWARSRTTRAAHDWLRFSTPRRRRCELRLRWRIQSFPMRRLRSGNRWGWETSRSSLWPILRGDSCTGHEVGDVSPVFPAPTKAQSKGCSRWKISNEVRWWKNRRNRRRRSKQQAKVQPAATDSGTDGGDRWR